MTEKTPPPAADEQPTTPMEPVGAGPTPEGPAPTFPRPAPGQSGPVPGGASAAPGLASAAPVGPSATAYPPSGPVPPRRGMPAWAVAVSVVGGVVLLGVGFAGGFGTGLLVSHRSSSAVERTDLRGSMMDRFSQGDGIEPNGRGFQRGGTGSGQGRQGERLLPNGTDGPTDGATTSP